MAFNVSRSVLAEKLIYLEGKPFSLDAYQPFRAVYDTPHPVITLMCGRQVGKSQSYQELVLMADGSYKIAGHVAIGDLVASLDVKTQKIVSSPVTWVSEPYEKPCLRLNTRMGHEIIVATTHPLRVWNEWRVASGLKVDDRVATVRKAGEFGSFARYTDEELSILAFLLGDGGLSQGKAVFTKANKIVRAEYIRCLSSLGESHSSREDPRSPGCYHVSSAYPSIILDSKLDGHKSATKFIPDFIFKLDERRTSLFLNRLWSTDGHVKQLNQGKYDISYSSISATMIKQVQALLWKFGIPSSIRKLTPEVYKKKGTCGYELRVETQPGIIAFLTRVGALTKSEHIPLPSVAANNNRDTFPIEIVDLIKTAYGHEPGTRIRTRENSMRSWKKVDLRIKPKYPPSHEKLGQYLEFFEATNCTNQAYRDIKAHLEGDVIWDEIESIEDVGVKTCVDYTVETHHNFILGGLITHNSTSLANFLLTEGISIPQFRSLFVAPSKEQTSRFSNTRFAKALFFSPKIKKHFVTNDMPANNVMLRMLSNGSEFFFTYAHDDAERVRGISADRLCFDEVQSIILEAVEPVIRECLAASQYKYRIYCGTPLSAENDIEVMLWQKSTMGEWVVQCGSCGAHNILGFQNLGPKFLICTRCEKGPLDVRKGRWFLTMPENPIMGFRIPQIALHRNVGTPDAYQSILDKRRDYSKAQFNNEVLGISDSLGARLISLDMLKGLCHDYRWVEGYVDPVNMHNVMLTVAGVDWGGQSQANVSRTALAIWGVLPNGKLRLLFGKIYPSGHAIQDLDDIAQHCQRFAVRTFVGDSGEGMLANAQMRQKIGTHIVYGNRYVGQNGKIRWNRNMNDPGYQSDRTMILDQVMHGIITKSFEFPHWEQFEHFSDDLLAAYEETSLMNRRVWKHAATRPDDFLHACALGWLASKIATGQVIMYQDQMTTDPAEANA